MVVDGSPTVPFMALFGSRAIEADEGKMRWGLTASDWLCLRDRTMSPGVLAAFIDKALNGTSLTLAQPGSRLGVVNLSVRFLRPVVPDGRELVAAVAVTDKHGDSMVASATVTDADGERVATAYQTSILLPIRSRPPARAEPVLATVLFTDLVGSTTRAGQLGDEQWRHLLADHSAVVRQQVEA
jgi:acyl-coenzyme A thioesterase PaaI-like protein